MSRSPAQLFDLDAVLRTTMIRHVEYHAVLESTNTTALELLSPLLDNSPSLVLTAEQTAGRGQKGNVWWSSGGALTCSIVIDPVTLPLSPEQRALLSLVSGLAVRDAVSEFVTDRTVAVKWPNDVYVGNHKICGILAEQHSVDGRQGLIIGIGINVNNSLQQAPVEIRMRATSMFDLLNRSFDVTAVLISVLTHLERRFKQAGQQLVSFLAEANHRHLLNGQQVIVKVGESLVTGQCMGIDDKGNLVIRDKGQVHRLSSGVVVNWHTIAVQPFY